MLAARCSRLASIGYMQLSQRVWSSSVRIVPMMQPMAAGWISRSCIANYSKDTKTAEPACNLSETPLKSNITQKIPESCDETSTISINNKETKTNVEECSTGAVTDVGVKLPSMDQVETFLFKSLVYFCDFAYYIFCLCSKLIYTYIIKNATVQTNWKLLLKRMEDARKDIKSK